MHQNICSSLKITNSFFWIITLSPESILNLILTFSFPHFHLFARDSSSLPFSSAFLPSPFHSSRLKTYLFHKYFPPWTFPRPPDWCHGFGHFQDYLLIGFCGHTCAAGHSRSFFSLFSNIALGRWSAKVTWLNSARGLDVSQTTTAELLVLILSVFSFLLC